MVKLYKVDLSESERTDLLDQTKRGVTSARKLRRAHILLLADEGMSDSRIAAALHVGVATVERIRKRFVEGGVQQALNEDARPGVRRKLDGKQEAYLVALVCSTPPDGRQRWTMQLLADQMVQLAVIDTLSDETVRRTLKKTTSSRG